MSKALQGSNLLSRNREINLEAADYTLGADSKFQAYHLVKNQAEPSVQSLKLCSFQDQDKNVLANQQLLEGFFRSAVELLRPEGEIHVTLKSGKPYDMWNIVGSAHRASAKTLIHSTIVSFKPESFPGYSHRRTIGFKEGLDKSQNEEIESRSRTYIFKLDK